MKKIINTVALTFGFSAPFPVATVSNIMRSFENTLSELDRVVLEQRNVEQQADRAAWAARDEAIRQSDIAQVARDEIDRADRIHLRLEALLD